MPGFPKPQSVVTPQVIASTSDLCAGIDLQPFFGATSPAAVTWVNGLAVYIPMSLPFEYLVQRIVWINGSTITSTSVDAGIYTADGRRLYSTTPTAMVGASSAQYVTLGTPLLLGPGRYYLAWACNNTTSRGYAISTSAVLIGREAGLLQQTSVATLPATATFAALSSLGQMPFMGITRLAS